MSTRTIYDHHNQSIHTALHSDSLIVDPKKVTVIGAGLATSELPYEEIYHQSYSASDTDARIKHKHEFAHFYSYNASGLSELHRIFLEYKQCVLELGIKNIIEEKDNIDVPFFIGDEALSFSNTIFSKALKQIQEQEAYLFGYGTRKEVIDIFDLSIQESFFQSLKHLNSDFDIRINNHRNICQKFLDNDKETKNTLPTYNSLDGREKAISSRSVIEAYAITIEIIAEYEFKIRYELKDKKRDKKKRIPSPLDSIALEYCLSVLSNSEIDIQSYVRYSDTINPNIYWSVSLVTFTSMQVPAINYVDGARITMGGMRQLNPAHRLSIILESISEGKLTNPKVLYKSDDESVLKWMQEANSLLGDHWSLKYAKRAYDYSKVGDLSADAQFDDHELIAWAAKAYLMTNTYKAISTASPYKNLAKIPFTITSDKAFLSYSSKDSFQISGQYNLRSATYILEMILTDLRWHSIRDKIYSVDVIDDDYIRHFIRPLIFHLISDDIKVMYIELKLK